MLNLPMFVCFSILIYCFFIYFQDVNFYSDFRQISLLINATVVDSYASEEERVAYGQNAAPWFAAFAMKKCRGANKTMADFYRSFDSCLSPFCREKTAFSSFLQNNLDSEMN